MARTVRCTRSDVLAPGAGYAPITITVDVAAGVTSTTNPPTVVGHGGEIVEAPGLRRLAVDGLGPDRGARRLIMRQHPRQATALILIAQTRRPGV